MPLLFYIWGVYYLRKLQLGTLFCVCDKMTGAKIKVYQVAFSVLNSQPNHRAKYELFLRLLLLENVGCTLRLHNLGLYACTLSLFITQFRHTDQLHYPLKLCDFSWWAERASCPLRSVYQRITECNLVEISPFKERALSFAQTQWGHE